MCLTKHVETLVTHLVYVDKQAFEYIHVCEVSVWIRQSFIRHSFTNKTFILLLNKRDFIYLYPFQWCGIPKILIWSILISSLLCSQRL